MQAAIYSLLGSGMLKLMDVQSRLLLVFSLYGDADVHDILAQCVE
jgi:hypothetical protein